MYATRLARAAASRPAAGLSSASHVGSTSRATSAVAAGAKRIRGHSTQKEDFGTHLRKVRKESEVNAAAHRASLEAAFDADLLALVRSNIKGSDLKAQLEASAAALDSIARAEVKVPADDLLTGPKHIELRKMVSDPPDLLFPGDSKLHQLFEVFQWVGQRPALKVFQAELEKEIDVQGATVDLSVSIGHQCFIFARVSTDLDK